MVMAIAVDLALLGCNLVEAVDGLDLAEFAEFAAIELSNTVVLVAEVFNCWWIMPAANLAPLDWTCNAILFLS